MTNIKALISGGLALLAVGSAPVAHAAIIPFSDTAADYSSPGASAGFPIDRGVVRTFTFAVGDVLTATISGTWGNVDFADSSAGADVYLDDILVAQCIEFDACWQDATGTQSWSYGFTAADLASGVLDDGVAELRVVQTSSFAVRLGSLALEGRVGVPEPGTTALLGLGLIGAGLARKRRAR